MKKSPFQKANRILHNLKTAHRIMVLNDKDRFTINLLENKINEYEKILNRRVNHG